MREITLYLKNQKNTVIFIEFCFKKCLKLLKMCSCEMKNLKIFWGRTQTPQLALLQVNFSKLRLSRNLKTLFP